jgi:tetratricopeptide (TPR) repeat protein
MIIALASALLASYPSVAPPSKQDIVVVGHATDNARANLAACLARHCPPNEDIDASLGLAEAQLLAGKYREARFTLLDSLGRNKREADAYPIPVSDLYRANGRVAAHLGYDEDFYRSTWGIYRTLKHGLPDAKDQQYSAMMEVAEMMGKTRGHERARIYYDSIAQHAREDGRPDIAALAQLRMILRHMPPYLRENLVKKIAYSTDPATKAAQLEGKLALARIAYEKHQIAKGDTIIGELAAYDIKKPVLVYAPAWELGSGSYDLGSESQVGSVGSGQAISVAGGDARGGTPTAGSTLAAAAASAAPGAFSTSRMGLNVEDMWADVGFRIMPDGKVADVEVLRHHGNLGWAKPLIASIGGRRYTPAKAGSAESYRKERYTYTSALEPGAGTKMAQHSPQPRVEYFDLSDISAAN